MRERFDDFMGRALYDAEAGYYARQIVDVGGARADFATSATLSDSLGRAMAGEMLRWLEESGVKKLRVIEVGAGDGSLALAVRRALPWWVRWRMEVAVVEVSEPLRAIQREKLGGRVRWFEEMSEAVKCFDGECFVYSNELVDAFPVRVFRRRGEELEELFVENGGEVFQLAEGCPDSVAMEVWKSWREGSRVEVHEGYAGWLAEWSPLLRRGRMVTVDYGDVFPALYRRMPLGTLRAYFRHERLTGMEVYARVGAQDLTADVNFSDLIRWGETLGWKTERFCSQGEFLAEVMSGSAVDEFLCDEGGAGWAFRVLIQGRV